MIITIITISYLKSYKSVQLISLKNSFPKLKFFKYDYHYYQLL